ncbi:serine/arginine-rich splicing factor SR45a isoform X2 [Manihot esculenta]|uniref:serine/arginine-rich splicing factor SR45a isoform X2 n=1 Tax=Manihot esculenta TaxID=3983 RepID=UPI001CC42905|nr:serine/arginine-rich splicing factor SR45a isoform X2 [Manihot esculenta]XP_043811572.1 serine/arginine-rich splicing factor SR45a isoform X2 [Manihot esculenta]
MSYSREGRSASPRTSISPGKGRRSRSLSRSHRSRSRSRDSVEASNPGNNLYVTGLSTRVTTSDLEKFFNKEGKVVECHLVTDPRTRESRGFAFVTMETVDDADRCIKYLNRSVLEGRLITVEKLNLYLHESRHEFCIDISNTSIQIRLFCRGLYALQKGVVAGHQLQAGIKV